MLIFEPKYYDKEIIQPVIGATVINTIYGVTGTIISVHEYITSTDITVGVEFDNGTRHAFYTTGVYLFSRFKDFSCSEFNHCGLTFWKDVIFERIITHIRAI